MVDVSCQFFLYHARCSLTIWLKLLVKWKRPGFRVYRILVKKLFKGLYPESFEADFDLAVRAHGEGDERHNDAQEVHGTDHGERLQQQFAVNKTCGNS